MGVMVTLHGAWVERHGVHGVMTYDSMHSMTPCPAEPCNVTMAYYPMEACKNGRIWRKKFRIWFILCLSFGKGSILSIFTDPTKRWNLPLVGKWPWWSLSACCGMTCPLSFSLLMEALLSSGDSQVDNFSRIVSRSVGLFFMSMSP